ncbi:MAG: hypothetical protein Q8O48_08125 [Anaerolineales bacterium]|nr:hypothetical protein [Anaerolineales bacterium]
MIQFIQLLSLHLLLIVLTDDAGNVSTGTLPPQEEGFKFSEMIANKKTHIR